MSKLLTSAVLGLGLLAGISLSAQAQSLSSIPPAGTPAANVPTQPQASTQRIVPDPGGSVTINAEQHQATKPGPDLVDHPYSTSEDSGKGGPKPN
jgi:hypothetical protein